MDPRPVLEIREPGTHAVLQYWHAAPGLLAKGLWGALKADPQKRTQEQVQFTATGAALRALQLREYF